MENHKSKRKILVIHGPNLNMLGQREPHTYGKTSLKVIDETLIKLGRDLNIEVETYQSNHEGAIVEKIQQAKGRFNGLIINPAAFTHTSIAIRDALLMLEMPVVEIHISNIYQREKFRHTSMISDVVYGKITGFGAYGYEMALDALAQKIPS